jgi:hypothetical protein
MAYSCDIPELLRPIFCLCDIFKNKEYSNHPCAEDDLKAFRIQNFLFHKQNFDVN